MDETFSHEDLSATVSMAKNPLNWSIEDSSGMAERRGGDDGEEGQWGEKFTRFFKRRDGEGEKKKLGAPACFSKSSRMSGDRQCGAGIRRRSL